MLRGTSVVLGCLGVLGGCGQARPSQPETAHEKPVPPARAPRWVVAQLGAETSTKDLVVVRFDDVEHPETFPLAIAASDERTELRLVYWSPTGEHVAYVVTSSTGQTSLWLASARDRFARRRVTSVPEIAEQEWGFSGRRTLSWLGPDTFLVAGPFDPGFAYYRVPVSSLVPELLGEYAGPEAWRHAVYSASPSGVLFTTASGESAELWAAAESGPPRRLGTGLSALEAELVWSPDGQHATWWLLAKPGTPALSGAPIGVVTLSDPEPPTLELVAGESPQIGLVQVPADTVVDAHPHGNLVFSNAFKGRALQAHGPGYAFAVFRDGSALTGRRYRIASNVSGATVEHGLGHGSRQGFGFLDQERFFYSRFVEATDSEESRAVVALREAGSERLISSDRYAPTYLDGVANPDQLFFTRSSQVGGGALWSVDLTVPGALAEQVLLGGSVVLDSPLKQGETRPPLPGIPGVATGRALLVATSDDPECRFIDARCHTGWTVVSFDDGVDSIALEPSFATASVVWSPDGSGLLALSNGLSFIPGPAYRTAFVLSESAISMLPPERWPSP